LISLTLFTFAHASYTARFSSATFLGDALRFSATLSLGGAFILGDAFFLGDWRRSPLAAPSFLATPSFLVMRMLGDACRYFEREKDKD